MKNLKLNVLIISLILINIFCVNILAVENIPTVNTTQKIYDYANIFPSSNKDTLKKRILSSITDYNLDIAIVTTRNNTYSTSDEYAKQFFIQNNFGFTSERNGILLLIDFSKNKTAVYSNGTAKEIFTDEINKKIAENTYSSFQKEDYLVSAFSFLNDITNYSENTKNIENDNFDTTKKIYDYANLLTESEEKDLYNSVTKYIEKTNYDMAIVTIDKNPQNSAMVFADDFYDYNGFGLDDVNSGLLFLIDMDTREMWISTTGKCINAYPVNIIDRILDKPYKEITNQNYFECANSFITGADYYFSKHINWIFVLVSTATVTGLFILIASQKHKTVKKATNAEPYITNFNITLKEDNFLHSTTNRIYSPVSSNSGSSGGSSSHFGSSGTSHGGGGRRF